MRVLLSLFALLAIGAAPVDWTRTVTRGANGAYVMGNPRAKVRLVEYLSYSCSHCAHFSDEASEPLRVKYVARGLVAVELRNAVRDRYDFATALLARCGGAARFFGQSEALFAAQDTLLGQAQAFEATNALPEDAAINDALKGMANGAGLSAFMVQRGLAPAAIDACLVDKPSQDVVLAMTKEAWEIRKIAGTPTLLVNGRATGVSTWALLEPKLRAAVAAR